MEIYIVRHATAVARAEPALDHARPLTPEGRERFEKAARGLVRLDVSFDRIYHSPWVRARQTAEILAKRVGGERVETDALTGTPAPALLSMLEGDRIALVGHEPWMGELVSLLLLGDTEHGDRFPLKKGGVAALTGEATAGGCSLAGLWAPRMLRRQR